MCPLRIILIFLSATLAGFFVLRNLKSPTHPEDDPQCLLVPQPQPQEQPTSDSDNKPPKSQNSSKFSKVCSAVESGFWTCVDMASGRYLWRHLVGGSSSESKRSE